MLVVSAVMLVIVLDKMKIQVVNFPNFFPRKHIGQCNRFGFWYLSCRQAVKALASLGICPDSPEP